ncbi:30S ribosomal protein S11 [Candidatus Saccharibacteria bacterium]|nr:30S ribosomal protein S11 [Candidatus Saccharibacteria bacterium]
MVKTVKKSKKKVKKKLAKAQLHIFATFNNTIISATDLDGNTLSWASAGSVGFKGSRKSTPYAAQVASERVIDGCKDYGIVEMEVIIKGVGSGRDAAVRALTNSKISVESIKDITGVPHNGCRPRKARRV